MLNRLYLVGGLHGQVSRVTSAGQLLRMAIPSAATQQPERVNFRLEGLRSVTDLATSLYRIPFKPKTIDWSMALEAACA